MQSPDCIKVSIFLVRAHFPNGGVDNEIARILKAGITCRCPLSSVVRGDDATQGVRWVA